MQITFVVKCSIGVIVVDSVWLHNIGAPREHGWMPIFMEGFSLVCQAAPVVIWMVIIPVIEIAHGARYFYDCPVDEYIPIYLLAVAVLTLVLLLLWLCSILCNDRTALCLLAVGFYSATGLLISGAVLVFRIYNEVTNKRDSKRYCHTSLYSWTVVSIFLRIVPTVPLFLLSLVPPIAKLLECFCHS